MIISYTLIFDQIFLVMSIEHSRMTNAEKSEVRKKWIDSWNTFCHWIIDEYSAKYPATGLSPKRNTAKLLPEQNQHE
jgi:hypothetical protein